MNRIDETVESPSYFWDCITLNVDCPFMSNVDPKLLYFGFGILTIYSAFLLMVVADLRFYWSLDNFQRQIDYYINFVRKKVRHVQLDQNRLVSTQERSENLLKRSETCKQIVTVLRGAIVENDPNHFSMLTNNAEENVTPSQNVWNNVGSSLDF